MYSELAYLYYITLGNKAICDAAKSTTTKCSIQGGYGLTNSGDFIDLRAHDRYWTGLQYEQFSTHAWTFWNDAGSQAGTRRATCSLPSPYATEMCASFLSRAPLG